MDIKNNHNSYFDSKTNESNEIKKKKDVFISYKRENAPFVARVLEELERHNISTWVDLSKLHKEPGDEYSEGIRKAINSSDLFLLIYTNHDGCSIEESDYIIDNELAYAIEKNKKILVYPQDPIDLNTSRIRSYIEKIQWLDTSESSRYQLDTQESVADEKVLAHLSDLINKRDGFSVFEDQNVFLIRMALQRLLGKITVFGNYTKLAGTKENEFYSNESLRIRIIRKSLFLTIPGQYKAKLQKLGFFKNDKIQEVERHLESIQPDNTSIMNQLITFIEEYYDMEDIRTRLNFYISDSKYKDISLIGKHNFTTADFINVVKQIVACNFIEDLLSGKTMFNGAELGVYKLNDHRTMNSEHPVLEMDLYYSDYFTFKCMTEMYHILCSINDSHLKIEKTGDVHRLAPFLCSLGLGGFLAVYTDDSVDLMWTKRSGNISSGNMWHFSFDETVSLLNDATKESDKIIVDYEGKVHIDINKLLYRALNEEIGIPTEMIVQENHGLFEVGIIRSERLEIELISQAAIHLYGTQSIKEEIKKMHDVASDGYLEISKIDFLPLGDRNRLIGKLLSPESYSIFERMTLRLRKNVGKKVHIGINTLIEDGCYIGDNARIGDNCRIHRNVFIDKNVTIGNLVKIQNNNSIYEGITLEDGVFVGTNVSFINDLYPRSILKNGQQVGPGDWKRVQTRVCYGASIGAGAVILGGVNIGKWAMVGAGAVVVNDVPEGAVVVGNPAKIIKYID